MIDVSNLKDALKTLGFVAYGDIYEKVFFEIGCSLKVDFQAKRLIYPNEIKGGNATIVLIRKRTSLYLNAYAVFCQKDIVQNI